jgi:hypothetical protein
MAYTPTDPRSSPREPTSQDKGPHPSEIRPSQYSDADHPRLVEEHHIVGPHGEDEIEATDEHGRRWYHLRPEPRRRADLIGFNYTWWLIWVVFIFVIFLPWGRGWGY